MKKTIIALFLFVPLYVFGQTKIYPQNELYKDSSLTNFVCKLQYAIYKKDKNYLLSVVDNKIENSFGGNGGIDEFKELWQIDNQDSPIWFYLSKLISLGGNFTISETNATPFTSFVFPYIFNVDIPNDTIDIFLALVVTADNVNIREKPLRNSKIVGHVSYDLVTVDYEKSYIDKQAKNIEHSSYCGDYEWYYITTLDGKLSGYVFWDYVWSPVGYRLFLNKLGGKWKITCLIAGD